MKNNTKIFVIYHRLEATVYSDVYQPICVGENKDEFNQFYLRDDIGDNIADKNYIFNELTAIYWVYKHIDEFKGFVHFGFCHYRRFFAFNGTETAYVNKFIDHNLIDVDKKWLADQFVDHDFIAPLPSHYKSVRKHYERSHNRKDINILLKVFKDKFPEYYEDASQYFDSQNEFLYNMFVFSKDDFLAYAKMLFAVIDEFCNEKKEKVVRLFLSERITGIFITHLINKGKRGLFFPVIHVRRKLLGPAFKQVIYNFKGKKSGNRSLFMKMKPLILCFMPRHVEQYFRRRKTK